MWHIRVITFGRRKVVYGERAVRPVDCAGDRLEPRCDQRHPPTLAAAPVALAAGSAALGPATAGHARVPQAIAAGIASNSLGLWIRLYRLEHRPAGHIPAADHRHWHQPQLATPPGHPGGLCHWPAQAHAQEQARPAEIPAGQGTARGPKKGALRANASYELWYADATEFELLPHLARCWMRRGQQREVKTPGQSACATNGARIRPGGRCPRRPAAVAAPPAPPGSSARCPPGSRPFYKDVIPRLGTSPA